MIATRFVCGVMVAACLLRGSAATAQPAQPASDETAPGEISEPPKWEVEVHGGLSFDRDASGGSSSLPTTGSTIQGLASLSTFYFGSGAALFNQIRPSSQITTP